MSDLKMQVKQMLIDRLKLEGMTPEQIEDQAPLFGEGLGLDSIDALELVLGIEQVFGVKIEDESAGLKAFKNIDTLTAFIAQHQPA
jgi:acyl carrier protein